MQLQSELGEGQAAKGKRLQAWVIETVRDVIMGAGFREKTHTYLHPDN